MSDSVTVSSSSPEPRNQCVFPRRAPGSLTVSSSPHYRPIVIGHRGSSYNVPEHTLASYRLALELGADYIEPDLVPTKDGVLVAVHHHDLTLTTNVEDVYPNRTSGYYVMDFTLEEVRALRVRQRVEDTPARSRLMDWMFGVPTLDEIVDLLWEWNEDARPVVGADRRAYGGRPGLYAELKRPRWIRNSTGIDTPALLAETLAGNPKAVQMFFNSTHAECSGPKISEEDGTYRIPPLVIQCFERDALSRMRETFQSDERFALEDEDEGGGREGRVLLPAMVLLASTKHCFDPDFWTGAEEMGLDGVGPDKACLLDGYGSDGTQTQSISAGSFGEGEASPEDPAADRAGREFMKQAFERNVAVHPWTERLEVEFVDTQRFDTAEDELRYLFCELGVNGIFAENVDVGLRVAVLGCPGERNNISPSPMLVAAVSSLLGLVLGSLFTHWANHRWSHHRIRRGAGKRSMAVPDQADDGDEDNSHQFHEEGRNQEKHRKPFDGELA